MLVADKKYTVKEFAQLNDLDENSFYELINGIIVKRISPSPRHQEILSRIYDFIGPLIKGNQLGSVYFAPIDLYLGDENQFIPDLLFISNEKKSIIKDYGIVGSPDMVVEILSPSTARYDRNHKLKTYQKNKINEYWIIDPKAESVEIYTLEGNEYDLSCYAIEGDVLVSKVFQGLRISAKELFGV